MRQFGNLVAETLNRTYNGEQKLVTAAGVTGTLRCCGSYAGTVSRFARNRALYGIFKTETAASYVGWCESAIKKRKSDSFSVYPEKKHSNHAECFSDSVCPGIFPGSTAVIRFSATRPPGLFGHTEQISHEGDEAFA